MANEITLTASLSAYKASVMSAAIGRSVASALATMTGNYSMEGTILVGTSGTLIPMGNVATPHWAWFKNLDAVNFVKIRNGASGADVIQLLAGEFFLGPLLTTGTFYAVADTGNCLLEYLVLSL